MEDPRMTRLIDIQREIERLKQEEAQCPARQTLTQAALEALSSLLMHRTQ